MSYSNWIHKTITGFILLFLIACGDSQRSEEEIIRPVRFEKVVYSNAITQRTFTGVTKPAIESNLSFKVSGNIEKISVRVGQQVNKGDLIANLDETDYRLQLGEANAAMSNALVQEQNSLSNYERVSNLYENGNVSVMEYERAKAAWESAKAQRESADKRVEQAGKQLSYTKLFAPINGIIGAKEAEENENVMTGNTIVQINANDLMEVLVGIPSGYISQIYEGEEVSVSFSALPGKSYTGFISEVSYVTGTGSTTYPVTIRLKETIDALRPGMAANVTLSMSARNENEDPVLIIPTTAVAEFNNQTYVFILQPADSSFGVIEKRVVRLGKLNTDGFTVLEGLNEQELVVTAGISNLYDGMKVKLIEK